MLKRVIFYNLIFLSTTLLYFLAQNFNLKLYSSFYLSFSLFCICSSLVLIFTDLSYKDTAEGRVFRDFFIGLLVYGFTNFIWFLNEEFLNGQLPENIFNILFTVQVMAKYRLILYFLEKLKTSFPYQIAKVCVLLLFFGIFVNSYYFEVSSIFNYFFIVESILSIGLISIYIKPTVISIIDFRYFIAGEVLWLLADLFYLFESSLNYYFMGNIVDFVYFLGFYLYLSSIIYTNFAEDIKLKFLVAKEAFCI